MRIAGVEVGKVKHISHVADTIAVVEFSADAAVVLTEGSRAVIRYDNLIGDRYLELQEGAGGRRRCCGPAPPSRRPHRPALDLDALIGGFRPLFRALDPVQVNALSGQLIAAVQGQGATIGSFLAQTAAVTNTLADRDELIGQVIINLEHVLGSLGDQSGQFGKAVTSLSELVTGWPRARPTSATALAYINAAAGSIADLLLAGPPAFAKRSSHRRTEPPASSWPTTTTSTGFAQHVARRISGAGPQGMYGDYFSFYLCDMHVEAQRQRGSTGLHQGCRSKPRDGVRRNEVLRRTQPGRHRRSSASRPIAASWCWSRCNTTSLPFFNSAETVFRLFRRIRGPRHPVQPFRSRVSRWAGVSSVSLEGARVLVKFNVDKRVASSATAPKRRSKPRACWAPRSWKSLRAVTANCPGRYRSSARPRPTNCPTPSAIWPQPSTT